MTNRQRELERRNEWLRNEFARQRRKRGGKYSVAQFHRDLALSLHSQSLRSPSRKIQEAAIRGLVADLRMESVAQRPMQEAEMPGPPKSELEKIVRRIGKLQDLALMAEADAVEELGYCYRAGMPNAIPTDLFNQIIEMNVDLGLNYSTPKFEATVRRVTRALEKRRRVWEEGDWFAGAES